MFKLYCNNYFFSKEQYQIEIFLQNKLFKQQNSYQKIKIPIQFIIIQPNKLVSNKTNTQYFHSSISFILHMFINNQFNFDTNIKKKVQNTTKYLFPKISILTSSTSKKQSQKAKQKSKLISEKDLYTQNTSKKVIQNLTTKDNLYSMNIRDILNPHKSITLDSQIVIRKKQLQKVEQNKNEKFIQSTLRKTYREINKLRSTFIARKSENLTPFEAVHLKQDMNNGKKSIGHYTVLKQLGHGGFATVYQVKDKNTDLNYAMKQYNLAQSFQCYQNQVKVGQYFKSLSSQSFKNSKNSQSIVQYIEKIRIGKKGYIFQELAGQSFSKLLSQIKGVFYNKQRVYEVRFQPFYQKMKKKQCFLSVMSQICQGVEKLNKAGFVHCDLKLQNIMISSKDNQMNDVAVAKIIDFGSTFEYARGLPKITITPEYMPPQLLMQFNKNSSESIEIDYDKIDVWSIGCIMLEIFTGIPLWFKYKCKLSYNDKNKLDLSIFALTNRDYSKIIKKQHELCLNLINNITFVSQQWQKYRSLLKQIFVVDPSKRISVQSLIKKLNSMK